MEKITQQTILATRQHFAEICDRCVEQAISGKVRVNDLDKYIQCENRQKARFLAGDSDNTFTFQQRAVWLQTGVCHALLA